MTRILVVDNYDSFVFTIVGYLQQLGAECEVVRNDARVARPTAPGFDGVLVSPGPGTPRGGRGVDGDDRGLRRAGPADARRLPGPPGARRGFGATVGRAPELLHGKTSRVRPRRHGVLAGLPSPFTATRYHSLTIDPATDARRARSPPGTPSPAIIMAAAAPRPAPARRAVPPRERAHRGRSPAAGQLAGGLRADRRGRRSAGLSPLVHDAEGVARAVAAG